MQCVFRALTNGKRVHAAGMNTLNTLQASLNSLLTAVQAKSGAASAGDQSLMAQLTSSLTTFQQQLTEILSTGQTSQLTLQQDTLPTPAAPAVSLPVQGAATAPSTVGLAASWLAPGEPGASLPQNYLKSPLYQAWVLQQPSPEGMSAQEFGKAFQAWQTSNPYYVNPQDHATFEAYAAAVGQATASDAASLAQGGGRGESLLLSYYGAAAAANPWSSAPYQSPNEAGPLAEAGSAESLYQRTVQASESRALLPPV